MSKYDSVFGIYINIYTSA